MAVELGIRPAGQITIEVGDQVRRFENAVLDTGWQSLLARQDGADGAMVPTWLHFGTGESEPQSSDSGLAQRDTGTAKAETSREYRGLVNASDLTAYSEVVVRFDYAAGELTGDNWTELGLSYDQAYAEPYNRALIRDENGAPVPLIVLSDQPVTVYVRLRLHLTDWGRTLSLGGNTAGTTGTLTRDTLPALEGTLTVDGNVASVTTGLWIKGFPVASLVAGGKAGQAESFDPITGVGVLLLDVAADSAWSASRLTFEGRDSAAMLHLDLSPALSKPADTRLLLRPQMTLKRG